MVSRSRRSSSSSRRSLAVPWGAHPQAVGGGLPNQKTAGEEQGGGKGGGGDFYVTLPLM